ncbi:MAG: NlpC/P60 family protein [Nocardioides sp.]
MRTPLRRRLRVRLASLVLVVAAPAGVVALSDGGAAQASSPTPGLYAAQAATSEVGYAFMLGGTGPLTFDGPGLTRYAWAEAGVDLEHSVSSQYASGTQVAKDQLQAGDLVVFYSHLDVGIYVGDGKVVFADEGSGVVREMSTALLPGDAVGVRPDPGI